MCDRVRCSSAEPEVVVVVFVVVLMVLILAGCGLIAAYVAFPHRGAELPGAPWLGDAMSRAADALPVIDDHASPDRR